LCCVFSLSAPPERYTVHSDLEIHFHHHYIIFSILLKQESIRCPNPPSQPHVPTPCPNPSQPFTSKFVSIHPDESAFYIPKEHVKITYIFLYLICCKYTSGAGVDVCPNPMSQPHVPTLPLFIYVPTLSSQGGWVLSRID